MGTALLHKRPEKIEMPVASFLQMRCSSTAATTANTANTTALQVQRRNRDMCPLCVWIQYVGIVPKRVRAATITTNATITITNTATTNTRQQDLELYNRWSGAVFSYNQQRRKSNVRRELGLQALCS